MAKDPAILLYTADFLTGTMLMTDDQVGKYIRILCLMHQKGRLTLKQMLKICLTEDEDIFCKFKQDEEGLYYNQRLEDEMLKRKKHNPYKIASATLGGLISSRNLTNSQIKYIRSQFNINDFIDLETNEEIKSSVKLWLSKCLTIYEDENENEDIDYIKGDARGGEFSNSDITRLVIESHLTDQDKIARMENLKEELTSSQVWFESVMRATNLSEQQTAEKVKEFIVHISATGEYCHPLSDIKKHSVNWIKKQINEKSNSKKRPTNNEALKKFANRQFTDS